MLVLKKVISHRIWRTILTSASLILFTSCIAAKASNITFTVCDQNQVCSELLFEDIGYLKDSGQLVITGNTDTICQNDLCLHIDKDLTKILSYSQSIFEYISKAYSQEKQFWDEKKTTVLNIYLKKSDKPFYTGITLQNLIVLSVYKPNSQKNLDTMLYVISHELFHKWMGLTYLKLKNISTPKEITFQSKALVEGLTDYYGLNFFYKSIKNDSLNRTKDILISIQDTYLNSQNSINSYLLLEQLIENESAITYGVHLLLRKWIQEGVITSEQLDHFTKTLPKDVIHNDDMLTYLSEHLTPKAADDFKYYIIDGHNIFEKMSEPIRFIPPKAL